MNRALRRISLACLVMFVALLINVNYLQGFESSSLATKPGNGRAFAQQYQYQRGSIVTADGVTVAESRPVKGIYKYQRHYPDGPVYAPVTGYDSLYSATGVESAENKLLSGTDPKLAVPNLIDLITGKPQQGANVELTINSKAQQAAYAGLRASGNSGGVVAINPRNGAILAMASNPSYNPNEYATFDGQQLDKNDAHLRTEKSQPLLNRAINETYPPGSTFKIVTSSTAFGTGHYNPSTSVYAPTVLHLPQTTNTLINNDGEVCGSGSGYAPLITAFAESCNTVFAHLGMVLGNTALKQEAGKFGMNSGNLTIPMLVSPSSYPLVSGQAYTAYSAIGQYDDTVTPLQEAMFSSAIANGGKLMKPYLVQSVKEPDLSLVQQATPSELSQPDSASTANEVKQMMVAVVNDSDGTGYDVPGIRTPGLDIAGKTGTAQNGANNTGLNDAVFTAFAPASNPTIAVGVVIKGGGYGAAAAAPIAVAVIKAYLAYLGRS
ncbi:MAG: peptidoglycan D,D-transpeptidase FtsI family protein [Streptosporangiaceae bacterium]